MQELASDAGPKPLRIVYSSPGGWPASTSGDSAHIAVLDASFNPPTKAHLALATLPRIEQPRKEYDAHLLIYSVRNADKDPNRPGDAAPEQRLEMIVLLAQQMEEVLRARYAEQGREKAPSVAVGVCEEPLVFAKSTLVHRFLEQRQTLPGSPPTQLYWVMGSDTITRVLDPKYYGTEENMRRMAHQFFDVERTTMVCAERSDASVKGTAGDLDKPGDAAHRLVQENALAASAAQAGCIELRELDADAGRRSSTAVRKQLAASRGLPAPERCEQLAEMVPSMLATYLVDYGPYDAS